jgi:hypothetical protein
VSSDQIAAAGAFLSGAGAVLGSWLVLKSSRKRWQAECDEKLRLYKEGIETGDRVSHPERER